MDRVREFLKRKESKIILSIIWGLGLATMFRQSCKNRNCIIVKCPKYDEIVKHQFKYDGDDSCYKYRSVMVKCDKKQYPEDDKPIIYTEKPVVYTTEGFVDVPGQTSLSVPNTNQYGDLRRVFGDTVKNEEALNPFEKQIYNTNPGLNSQEHIENRVA